jgi:putative transcriptional regulator
LEHVREILEKYPDHFDRVGIMGTVSRALADKLGVKPDFEFATLKQRSRHPKED